MQMLAGLEEGDDLARYFNCGARSRVPAGARIAIFDRESTEAAYLDAGAPHAPSRRTNSDFVIAVPRLAAHP